MNLNILVADDCDSLANQLCEKVGWKGHTAKAVALAEHAIEEIKNTAYNLVFMDNNFGDGVLRGLQVTKQIRSFDTSVPIYIFSTDKISQEELNECGATGYINKDPTTFWDEIYKTVEKYQ